MYQLVNELVLFNMNECLFFGYSAASNVVQALDSFTSWRFFNASLEVMTFVHKAPVAISSCMALTDTYGDLYNMYRWWTWQDAVESLAAITANAILNTGDIFMELQVLEEAFVRGDFS